MSQHRRFVPSHRVSRAGVSSACALLAFCGFAARAQIAYRFTCSASARRGQTALTQQTIYKAPPKVMAASGFDLQTAPAEIADGTCVGDKPFFFSVTEPDGDYQVSVEFGAPHVASDTTVRAESRRLMVQQLKLHAGQWRKETFNVNVRTPTIYLDGKNAATEPAADLPKLEKVHLKPREIGALDWDEKLTLEFNGEHPSFRSLTITPIRHVPTVYLAGDSTVVDQDKEPWAAWGQMLPRFFGPGITIANDAESGETIRSFVGENRYAKVMSTIKPGDYLMIQFAHNDQKPGRGYVPAETDFKDYLRRYIADARSHGAHPILVTPMNRRRFDAEGKIVPTLGKYPEAMRQVAAEQKVPLIDLNTMSKTLFETMGEQGTLKAFVHYPAHTFPGQDKPLADNTHFNSYGAYELARCIVQSIRDQHLPLRSYLRKGIAPFHPAQPDPVADWTLPPSPSISIETPYGR